MAKTCSKCHKEKSRNKFYKRGDGHPGGMSECKECVKARRRAYYKDNKKIIKDNDKVYYTINKKRIRLQQKNYHDANKAKIKTIGKAYHIANKERENAKCKDYYIANKERAIAYYKTNKEHIRDYQITNKERFNEAAKKRLNLNPKFKLSKRISCAVRRSLRGSKNGNHWENLVGYTVEQIKKHLEKQFQPTMSWDNYGKWHIDHRIPVSAFSFVFPEDVGFKRCWALENLQPLWAEENIRKGSKLNKREMRI